MQDRNLFFLPVPVGATFSFPVDLHNYWAASPKEFEDKLKPGTYSLEAQFIGFIGTDHRLPLAGVRGQVLLLQASFDMVNPKIGGLPTSNKLQFEVPRQ